MKSIFNFLVFTSVAVFLCLFAVRSAEADVTTMTCVTPYDECLQKWKAARVEFLKSETGYLNLAGLFWLDAGRTSFGSDPANDLIFPESAAPFLGTFELEQDQVTVISHPKADIRFAGERVARIALPDDTTGEQISVTHGALSWSVIKRDRKYAIRLRDYAHPGIESFAPIDYFPTNREARVVASFHAYETPRIIHVGTVIEGLSYNPRSPGVVRFEKDGEQFELEAYDANGELFFVFGDRTSGRESYPAGRFLYAYPPDKFGNVMLDFNTAQNPPCAFNDFATCPVASPRNRMDTRIEAGERYQSH